MELTTEQAAIINSTGDIKINAVVGSGKTTAIIEYANDFGGNINSYTYADEGASLYDVLNLHNGNHALIKDKLIGGMKDTNELVDYIEKTEDVQLSMMVEIVKEYGNKIPNIIKAIKSLAATSWGRCKL